MSPWQQTSHSLYHQLSVCLPVESHPCGTEEKRGGGGGIIFWSLSCFCHQNLLPDIMLHLHPFLLPPSHSTTQHSHYGLIIFSRLPFDQSSRPPTFFRQTCLLPTLLTFSSQLSTYLSEPPPLPPHSFHSPPLLSRCQARLRQHRAGSMAGSPSLTGNYTAEQQRLLRWAWETEMQKL